MNATENQTNNDRTYTEAYHTWVDSLSPEHRAELDALNLTEPDIRRTTSKYDDETSLLLAVAPVPDTDFEEDSGDGEKSSCTRRDVADALASFCARVRAHPNPLMAFDSLCFASGLMDVEGLSQTALARRHGVTKAAFSRQVNSWIDLFDLPQARGCRSALAREAHSRARLDYVKRMKHQATGPVDEGSKKRRNRYPARADDPSVVYVRGLDSFRLWFQRRTHSRPLSEWMPDARSFLRKELTWFVKLHDRLGK